MSINSKMQSFTLQEIVESKDSLGSTKLDYNDIKMIQVSINKVHKTNTTNDGLSVNVATYTGITSESLEENKNYRIYSPAAVYKIKSFINGRWTALQLEVIE